MRTRLFALWGALAVAGLASADPVTKAIPEPPPVAAKAGLPGGLDDLKAFQKQVRAVTEQVIPVTVCLQVGGASGSGVIVSEDGLILTAGHVVSGKPGRPLIVVLPDGSRVKGKVLGFDPKIDSGMAKITDPAPGGKWPYAELAPSKELKEGQWVVAVGHPGGYKKERPPVVRVGRVGNPKFTQGDGVQFVQTDCSLVGGDSGGPLFDMRGRVIGIHSRIGDQIAQNLDVPSDRYEETWKALSDGDILGVSPYLGVRMAEDAKECKLGGVTQGSPADRAGFKTGDVITEFAGTPVSTYDEMVKILKEQKPYAEVDVKVERPAKAEAAPKEKDKEPKGKDKDAKDKETDPKDKEAKEKEAKEKEARPKTETITLKVTIGWRPD
jgi:serine protease Do